MKLPGWLMVCTAGFIGGSTGVFGLNALTVPDAGRDVAGSPTPASDALSRCVALERRELLRCEPTVSRIDTTGTLPTHSLLPTVGGRGRACAAEGGCMNM